MNSTSEPWCSGDCYNASFALIDWLMSQSYSPDIIPSTTNSLPLSVLALFALVKIVSLDNTGVLTTSGAIALTWTDSKLKWNKSDFSDLTWLQIAPTKIWTPVMTLLNPAGSTTNFPVISEPVWSDLNGSASSTVDAQFVSACAMDLTYFPYDKQTCFLEFTEINYWVDELMFVATTNVSFGFFTQSVEWKIADSRVDTSFKLLYVGNNFSTLRVRFDLVRQSTYYSVVLVYPTILLEVLMLLVFVLPHGSVLKVTLSASLVLTMYVLQKDSAKMLPSFDASKYPRLILGLSAGMGLGAASLVTSVLSVILSQLDIPLPSCFKRRVVHPGMDEKQPAAKTNEGGEMVISVGKSEAQSDNNSMLTSYLKEILKLKRERIDERKQMIAADRDRKQNAQAWQRIEFIFNIVVGAVYTIVFISFTLTCVANTPTS